MSVCPKCKGEGYYKRVGEELFGSLITFGLIPLLLLLFKSENFYERKCGKCDGTGHSTK